MSSRIVSTNYKLSGVSYPTVRKTKETNRKYCQDYMLVPLIPSVVRGEGSLLAVNLSLKTLNLGEQSSGSHACSICSDGTLDSSAISLSASRRACSNKEPTGLASIRLCSGGIEYSAPISEEQNIALLLRRPSRDFTWPHGISLFTGSEPLV